MTLVGMLDEIEEKGQIMQIPDEVLQALLDRAYDLAVEVHYTDVPAWGVEMPVIQVLRQIRKDYGLVPANYGLLEDPQFLLEEDNQQQTA